MIGFRCVFFVRAVFLEFARTSYILTESFYAKNKAQKVYPPFVAPK
jgi:hypothetical protein